MAERFSRGGLAMIVGDRKFVEIPGSKTHELPPLLVRTEVRLKHPERVMEQALGAVEQSDLMPLLPGENPIQDHLLGLHPSDTEIRRMDLAINLVDSYEVFLLHWHWGHNVIEWIRQCEITFGNRLELRNLLRADLWPHAGRTSFVTLLEDKAVDTQGIGLEKAVGMRLTFRQPPPLKCFSDQFLFYLNGTIADTAYQTWAALDEDKSAALPPERFHFEVVNMSLE